MGWVNPRADDAKVLKVFRLSIGLIAVLGLLIALWVEDIIAIYQVALAFTASALVAPVLAGRF